MLDDPSKEFLNVNGVLDKHLLWEYSQITQALQKGEV